MADERDRRCNTAAIVFSSSIFCEPDSRHSQGLICTTDHSRCALTLEMSGMGTQTEATGVTLTWWMTAVQREVLPVSISRLAGSGGCL